MIKSQEPGDEDRSLAVDVSGVPRTVNVPSAAHSVRPRTSARARQFPRSPAAVSMSYRTGRSSSRKACLTRVSFRYTRRSLGAPRFVLKTKVAPGGPEEGVIVVSAPQ